MSRTLTPAEIWSAIDTVGVLRDASGTVGSTTLDSEAASGQATLSVADESNFAAGDWLRVGNEANVEWAMVETTSAGSITLVSNLAYTHASGEAVEEAAKTELGEVSDDGLDVEFQADRTQVNAATRRERLAHLIGNVNGRLSFSTPNYALENLLAAMGVPEDNLHGAGTAADPDVADLTPDDWDSETWQAFFFTGTLKNGDTVEGQIFRTSVDPNKTISHARGQAAQIPFAVDFGHARTYHPAPSV